MVMKIVKSMEPMRYENNSNFKLAPYKAWISAGGKTVETYYEWRKLRLLLRFQEKLLPQNSKTAILCFAEPPSLEIDAFPWWGHHEIIPMLWDCWPKFWDYTEKWFRLHRVKSAIFTSSQTAYEFRRRLPKTNILTITEGIDAHIYLGQKPLTERSIDFLQYGRVTKIVNDLNFGNNIRIVSSKNEKALLHTREDLVNALSDSKIVLAVPRCDMQPELAQGIETLTQRYWECMLSGVVILGRSPKELTELIGYDPVVPIDREHIAEQVKDIVNHIDDYQELVCQNMKVAQQKADWSIRIKIIMEWLKSNGYSV